MQSKGKSCEESNDQAFIQNMGHFSHNIYNEQEISISDAAECSDSHDDTSKGSDIDAGFTKGDLKISDDQQSHHLRYDNKTSTTEIEDCKTNPFESIIKSEQATQIENDIGAFSEETEQREEQFGKVGSLGNQFCLNTNKNSEIKQGDIKCEIAVNSEHVQSHAAEKTEHPKVKCEINGKNSKSDSAICVGHVQSQDKMNNEHEQNRAEMIEEFIHGEVKDTQINVKNDSAENQDIRNSSEHIKEDKLIPKQIEKLNECSKAVGVNQQYLDNYEDLGLQTSDVRMVVIGKAGNGKSETANTIIGEDRFETDMCASSVTHVCQREYIERNGRRISVVDTPGLFDVSTSNDEIAKEIANFISLTIPGPHAVLFIGKIGRFTQEDQNTFDKVVEYFGESILDHCIVVFTYYDVWKNKNKNKTIADFVESSKEWSKITERCSNRYIAFENNPSGPKNDKQCDTLISMVTDMKQNSKSSYYSNDLYIEATNKRLAEIDREKKIREEEVRLKELERKLIEEERRLISEERRRQEEERNRQERERERQERERRRQIEETERLREIKRQNKEEKRRLAAEEERMERRERKLEKEEERAARRRERQEAEKEHQENEKRDRILKENAESRRKQREEELRRQAEERDMLRQREEELRRKAEERYKCTMS